VAVPGTVSGLCFALKEYGTLDLKTVLEPALRFARQGYAVDAHDRTAQALVLKELDAHPRDRRRFDVLIRKYLNGGEPWKPDDRFVSPQTRVLEIIAKHGADGFYHGPVAEAILSEIQRSGGILEQDDLSSMAPVVRAPLEGRIDGCEVYAMPPPSSGGVALLESLNILHAWEKTHSDAIGAESLDTAEALHLLAEILKHVFADRAAHLGDADFVKVPVDRLIGNEHAARIAARIDPRRTLPTAEYGDLSGIDDGGTSHFSIIDREGNAVACTETINLLFGSLVVEPEFGIVLNNEMDDFAAEPGKPNAFGLVQSAANAVAPRKKPLSSMCPTIVVREGKAVCAVGASGGPRIISGTLQVLLLMMRGQVRPEEAVARPRIHHQWLPDFLDLDAALLKRTRGELDQRGHHVRLLEGASAVQAVSRRAVGLQGGSDPRKGGRPAGY
jgi:gamma-glutamyltranspeptidase/glutathione hydrolase